MGILLKMWGKKTGIIDRFKLSSYSVLIMMLYYLIVEKYIQRLELSINGEWKKLRLLKQIP